jgi:glucose-1-phosphate cytidylyltransferase
VRDWLAGHAAKVRVPNDDRAGVCTVWLQGPDMSGWTVTFTDTGIDATIGERLRAARPLLVDEDMFLANYGDFSDVSLPAMINDDRATGATATFLAVRPQASFHLARSSPVDRRLPRITPFTETNEWINGGFFILRQGLFEALGLGEELVNEPFNRLSAAGKVVAYPYTALDTAKDRARLDGLWANGDRPWVVWDRTHSRLA